MSAEEQTMDTMAAFAMGQATKHQRIMVFDWDRAARLIRASGAKSASAGLRSDWEWTGGAILHDGDPVPEEDTYTFLASSWARPELKLGGKVIECWIYHDDSPGWSSGTYWPDSALAILRGEAEGGE